MTFKNVNHYRCHFSDCIELSDDLIIIIFPVISKLPVAQCYPWFSLQTAGHRLMLTHFILRQKSSLTQTGLVQFRSICTNCWRHSPNQINVGKPYKWIYQFLGSLIPVDSPIFMHLVAYFLDYLGHLMFYIQCARNLPDGAKFFNFYRYFETGIIYFLQHQSGHSKA